MALIARYLAGSTGQVSAMTGCAIGSGLIESCFMQYASPVYGMIGIGVIGILGSGGIFTTHAQHPYRQNHDSASVHSVASYNSFTS
jgi:hypothetical protein